MLFKSIISSTLFFMLVAPVHALLISDLDLNSQTFTVDSMTTTSATGSSNGISYSLSSAGYYLPFSNMTESQRYNDMPGIGYDDLHLGNDFMVTFNQQIDYLLVALANDNNTGDGINLVGATLADTKDISVTATHLRIDDIRGALVLYEFAAPTSSISHLNIGLLDGFDVSFFAGTNASVPEPSILWLLGSGVALLGFARRKA